MRYKSSRAMLTKTVGEAGDVDDAGVFEAIVSVFDVVDWNGDVVRPGAFVKSIERWNAGHDTMPLLWHHRLDDPRYNVGSVVEMAEIPAGDQRIPEWADPEVKANGGLWIKARVDTGDDASEISKHVLKVLRNRRTTQFSYGYDVMREKSGSPNELHEVFCHEVSVVQLGANSHTELGATKDADEITTPETGQAGAEPLRWPRAAKARAACALLVADLQHDEAEYWSL